MNTCNVSIRGEQATRLLWDDLLDVFVEHICIKLTPRQRDRLEKIIFTPSGLKRWKKWKTRRKTTQTHRKDKR